MTTLSTTNPQPPTPSPGILERIQAGYRGAIVAELRALTREMADVESGFRCLRERTLAKAHEHQRLQMRRDELLTWYLERFKNMPAESQSAGLDRLLDEIRRPLSESTLDSALTQREYSHSSQRLDPSTSQATGLPADFADHDWDGMN
jgi:hypothetical protein